MAGTCLHWTPEQRQEAAHWIARYKAIRFRTHLPPPAQLPPLYLRGLAPDARYEVEGVAGARSGLAWMRAGLYLDLQDFQSTVRHIRKR